MPKNYWMVVQSPENFRITQDRGFDVHGLTHRQRRRAQRIEPDDRVLYYVSEIRKWTATATVTSKYFEDRTQIWTSNRGREEYPLRVHISPLIVLDEPDYIDALELGPRLEYLKRWAPEQWPLAFIETLHILPQKDYRLIEGEMKRFTSKRRRRRDRSRKRESSHSKDGKLSATHRDERRSQDVSPSAIKDKSISVSEAHASQADLEDGEAVPKPQVVKGPNVSGDEAGMGFEENETHPSSDGSATDST